MPANLLNANTVATAAAKEKPYKLNDGEGLNLLVKPNGARLWQFRYKVAGRESVLSIGPFKPQGGVSLAAARKARDDARALLRQGKDPMQAKKAQAAALEAERAPRQDTFAHFADKALADLTGKVEAGQRDGQTLKQWTTHFAKAKAHLGHRAMGEISAMDVLDFLRTFERLGQLTTMHRVKRKISVAFDYAVLAKVVAANPVKSIPDGQLEPEHHTSHAAITDPARYGQLLRAIDAYQGQPATVACLKLSALCFVRPAEIRKGRWQEIDWQNGLWQIPAERMKKVGQKRHPHTVSLSRQALVILRDLQAIHGDGELIFPALGKGGHRPLSENTINSALRGMGFANDEMTGHGFRASAETIMLDCVEWPAFIAEPTKLINKLLAHIEPNQTHRAYDRAQLMRQRIWTMQHWADLCDSMREGAEIIPISAPRAMVAR